ncbi:MAG: UvrD-helicase domain-containing protein, partial [Selenomonadaceae bacterium]|nr:UvrD-helicase domain-containing protein [Selenomonadaceae bacterium]
MSLSNYDFEEYEEEIDESDFRSNSVEKIFEDLNPRQVEAVECLQGPLLVIAGAGSGKTRVLTCRIANLLNHGVAPWNVLAITFTNKAANEMKTRAENMIGQRAKSVWLSTFHSFCAKILRIEAAALKNYDKNFAIFSAGDSKMLIRECIRELELDEKIFDPAIVQGKISAAKNRLFNANKFKEAVSFASQKSDIDIQIAKVYKLYEKRMIEQNAMDFDDLLMVAVNLFATNKEVLEKYQEKFKYILVDEYQDTNVAQYKLMKMLAAKYQNV